MKFFVPNWRDSWKWLSVQVGAFQIASQSAVAAGLVLLPEDQRLSFVTAHLMQYLYYTIVVTFIQTFARVINQTPSGVVEPLK